ncbi:MAG: amidohydrolase family protein, partial [Adhaeribacter sp.]|nr:amidohydrolase family protein [Adhaeribacter sp.]
MMWKKILLAGLFGALAFSGNAQELSFEEYEPKSGLTVPEHPVKRAKYPFIDVHNHQNASMDKQALEKLVKDMDGINLQTMVNLSGGTGDNLKKGLTNMKGNYPTRFLLFANVDFKNIDDPDFGPKAATQLEQDVKNGAQGLKIFKNLGLTLNDKNGKRIATDDPRLDPIWAKCGQLGIPVLIHTGEPQQF